MTAPDDPRRPPRLTSGARVLWAALGRDDTNLDRLAEVTATGARIVSPAHAGTVAIASEIRFEALDGRGDPMAIGLGRVVRVDATGVVITFLALGIDPRLVAAPETPPPPSVAKGPPPMPQAAPVAPPPMPQAAPVAPPPLPREVRTPAQRPVEAPPPSQARAPIPRADVDDVAAEIEPLRVRRAGLIIGIDLGTTFTCAAHVVDGRPQIIPSRTGTGTIPSMITFDPDGTWYVGQRAADRQVLYPMRTVYGSKRLVGRTFRPELAAELQKHFAYPLGEADGRRFGVRIDDRVISMDTIAARVLDEVRSTAEAYLQRPVEAAVITVPAYFSEVQREAVRRAAREANLVVHRIVNEPTAAAVAYGHKQQGQSSRIAVWDFGGGTFDFSIVRVDDGQLEVLATGGDNFVGGTDFDDLLASHLLSEFQRAAGQEVDPEPQQVARLREAAEVAKRALSVETEHRVELADFTRDPSRALRVEVTRARFDELTLPLIERTLVIAREVMASSGLTSKDIDDVLLVGGTTRIPAVQRAVAELFQRRPSKRINPDEAVAMGAALLGDEIGSGNALTLLDILPMSVGRGVSGMRFEPVVPRYTRLPTERQVTLDADLLGNVTLPLFQGESPDVSGNEYLCTVIVEDRSLWDNGRVSLRLSFDEHCVMAVEALNAKTGRPLPVRLDRTRSVEDVLRELGRYDGPAREAPWQPPPTRLGKALGKLFKIFGRS